MRGFGLLFFFFWNESDEAGETAHERALAAPKEGPVPTWQLTGVCKYSSRGFGASTGTRHTEGTRTYVQVKPSHTINKHAKANEWLSQRIPAWFNVTSFPNWTSSCWSQDVPLCQDPPVSGKAHQSSLKLQKVPGRSLSLVDVYSQNHPCLGLHLLPHTRLTQWFTTQISNLATGDFERTAYSLDTWESSNI